MKNQVFDWSRFTLALRKEIVENWRQLVLALIVLYAVLSIIMIIGNWMTQGRNDQELINLRYIIAMMAFSFSTIIMASLSFRGLMTKTSRTELLTSPSSMTEKFCVNTLIYVVGYIVSFFVIIQLADLTRIVVLWPAQSDSLNVPGPICFLNFVEGFHDSLTPQIGHLGIFKLSLYIGLLASPGLYLLGSVLWPRLSFLKTFAAVYVIEFVVFLFGMFIIRGFGSFQEFAMRLVDNIEDGTFSIIILVVAAVQLVLYWVLAWIVFRRKDIVSRGVFH